MRIASSVIYGKSSALLSKAIFPAREQKATPHCTPSTKLPETASGLSPAGSTTQPRYYLIWGNMICLNTSTFLTVAASSCPINRLHSATSTLNTLVILRLNS